MRHAWGIKRDAQIVWRVQPPAWSGPTYFGNCGDYGSVLLGLTFHTGMYGLGMRGRECRMERGHGPSETAVLLFVLRNLMGNARSFSGQSMTPHSTELKSTDNGVHILREIPQLMEGVYPSYQYPYHQVSLSKGLPRSVKESISTLKSHSRRHLFR